MEKIMAIIDKYMLPLADKLNGNKYLTALRDAFMLTLPLIIFGSVFVVLSNLPYLDKILGVANLAALKAQLGCASNATMSVLTIFVVFGIGYNLSKQYKIDAIYGAATAVASFLILTPTTFEFGTKKIVVDGVLPLDRLGAKGMFVGIIGSFIAVEIYRRVVAKNWTIKMPEGVPDAVSKSFSALIPAFITLTTFLLIKIVFTFTPWGNVHDFVYKSIQAPLMVLGSGLPATLIAVLCIQLFWFFGLHGQIIVNSVLDPIWRSLSLENLQAYQAGAKHLPHIVNKQFMDTFTVGMGGTGMTLAVIIAIFAFAKSKQLKELAKLAAPAGIFNVNEPVIFGLPIVLNPMILIPWIIAPLIVTAFTYFVMSIGLVPIPIGVDVPWTVPIFLSGMLATNSVAGGILQLVNLAIVLVIWSPFVIIMDRQYKKAENDLKNTIKENSDNKNSNIKNIKA
ncbi:PTS cellobiose transporter subunit IIC [Clostridium estertheticum]|uniref:Permease IIC component n=1 Tax=Clostridium estertheticum TaxID=238834 RepID=A0AA47EKT9_9CLOT|nr:PTS cellobiose transporter subunit IIC [Clostridium estertheticum]MBU3154497.1 PTS cellobiose transporter subunit IIC [Clostridium estertheticum]MBU3201288.1 PTS cellobiose transporter subunit IIC [Clostridium estertheticum]WAG62067.1 PTS cellobiose transporter subunit IIC [Clostridium estertheticum]WAG63810.1 PTS cellobiose transporter subunit IIC [Clostridium estertheticum]